MKADYAKGMQAYSSDLLILRVQSLLKLKDVLSNFIQGLHSIIFDKGKYFSL